MAQVERGSRGPRTSRFLDFGHPKWGKAAVNSLARVKLGIKIDMFIEILAVERSYYPIQSSSSIF